MTIGIRLFGVDIDPETFWTVYDENECQDLAYFRRQEHAVIFAMAYAQHKEKETK